MSLSVGILGLPNVGKSTLFKLLTKNPVDISNYPFCTIEPNVGVVEVPDKRLEKLAEISKPKKIVKAIIRFVDVAGLVKGAHKGEGLGNQFLAHLRECDALLHIVRCFKNENIAHVEGEINPKRDIEIVKEELILKDLETIERRMEKIEKEVKQQKKEKDLEFKFLENLKEKLVQGKMAREVLENSSQQDKEIAKNLFLLTTKPQIYLLNCQKEEIAQDLKDYLKERAGDWLILDLKEELEKSELTKKEREELGIEEPQIDILIKKCYKVLNLITFFTIVGKEEARAWPIERGSSILEGAGMIHSDFKEKFIRAEVINWQKLIEVGNWKKAQEIGLLKQVGKDYILEDGDVVEIKI